MANPTATVHEIDGRLVLEDPAAVGMMRAVGKHNCISTFKVHEERVAHFVTRIKDLNQSPNDVVITLINVDDSNGRVLADILMPGYDWQQYRDIGEIPFARGLAAREGIQDFLDHIDKDAGDKLKTHEGIAVVVVDHDTAEIFSP